jgi:hypothetical protein
MNQEENKPDENIPEDLSALLYKSISGIVLDVFKREEITTAFGELSDEIGESTTKKMIGILVQLMCFCTYGAVICYDNALKHELDEQFKHIAHHINLSKADLEGQKGAITILRKVIEELKQKFQVAEIQKQTGVNVE